MSTPIPGGHSGNLKPVIHLQALLPHADICEVTFLGGDRTSHAVDSISGPAESPEVVSSLTPGVVVSVEHLGFSYGDHQALDDVSFRVLKGEAVALLGHNGAGKTTTIRVLNGLLCPDRGEVRVLGLDPVAQGSELRQMTAVVTDSLGLHDRDTPRGTLEYHARLWGLDVDSTVAKGIDLLDRFGLKHRVDERIKSFSRGMRQRLAIARALVNEPKLILMDEPTLGMDPVARQDFRELLRDLCSTGVSVVISTHDLSEVERVCNHLVIMQNGRTIIEGSPQECMKPFMRDVAVEIECEQAIEASAIEALKASDRISEVSVDSVLVTFRAADVDAIAATVRVLVENGQQVVRVGSHAPSLEDVYLRLHNVVRR